jgi:cell division septation protein DedD
MILLSEVRKTSLPFVVIAAALCLALSSCSRENRDWRSAQAADSLESYDQFLQRHPESELAAQARARLLQLTEERDWQRASTADTADAYSQFLNQHPSGKWSAEGRIRLENFSLEGQPVNAAANQSAVVEPRSTAPSQTAPRAGTATAINANVPGAAHAAPAAVATPVTQSASTTESFGIQLGAFSSEAKANSEWQRLQSAFADELGSLEPHIVSASTSAGILFRLQSRLPDEAKAREVCAALAQKSQGCVVVLPQH